MDTLFYSYALAVFAGGCWLLYSLYLLYLFSRAPKRPTDEEVNRYFGPEGLR